MNTANVTYKIFSFYENLRYHFRHLAVFIIHPLIIKSMIRLRIIAKRNRIEKWKTSKRINRPTFCRTDIE